MMVKIPGLWNAKSTTLDETCSMKTTLGLTVGETMLNPVPLYSQQGRSARMRALFVWPQCAAE